MSRLAWGSANSTASSNATILYSSDTNSRFFSVSIKARKGNSGNVYLGGDTTVLSSAGYELDSADTLVLPPVSLPSLISVKAHDLYMSGGNTGDLVDWVMLLET